MKLMKWYARIVSVWAIMWGSGVGYADEPQGGFVTVKGTKLQLNGGDFYFSGANSFSMLYSENEAEEQYEIARDLGLNALRIWGFWNGEDLEPQRDENGTIIRPGTPDTDVYGHYVLQSRPGRYPEEAWRRLDYAIYLAHVYDIKLIVALLNEWPEFGGLETYMEWVGIEIPHEEGFYAQENALKSMRNLFWESDEAQQIYFDYVEHLLNRVNTYTGVAYKDDPAIMIWEVMNEPRFGPWEGNSDATVVRDWIQEAAAFIKSIDSNHLVSTGEEGFLRSAGSVGVRWAYPWNGAGGEGIDFALNAQIPEIDVLTFHLWPFQWGLWNSSGEDHGKDMMGEYPDLAAFPPEWINEHVRIANEANKPLYLGEFGFQILRRPGSDLAERDWMMQSAYDAARDTNLAGAAYFHITASHDPDSAVYDGPMERKTLLQAQYYDDIAPHDIDFRFDVFCPEDQTTCAMIEDYTAFMTARVQHPDPPYELPCLLPQTVCEGACVLLDSHPDHCGACGVACGETQVCQAGLCVDLTTKAPSPEVSSGLSCNVGGSSRQGHAGLVSLVAILFLGAAVRRRKRS